MFLISHSGCYPNYHIVSPFKELAKKRFSLHSFLEEPVNLRRLDVLNFSQMLRLNCF